MKKSYAKIPENLKGQVIAITGSLPGVGKSYAKEKIAENLKNQGYKVVLTGSTNKACLLKDGSNVPTIYSSHVAGWAESKKVMAQAKGFVRRKEEDCKTHMETNAFIFVDEAFMLSQTDLDLLQKQFPQCCIVLFGDPNQFPPIEDSKALEHFEEMKKDQYSPYIGEIKKAIKKGIAKDKIFNIDFVINLNKQYRVKTPELEKFLKNVRSGFPSQLQLLQFLQKHQYNFEKKYDFAICRTWENGVYNWQNSNFTKTKRVFRSLIPQVNGVYVGQNNIGAIKNSLYDVKGHSFENDTQITDISEFSPSSQNYKLQGGVTCHSIQGTTLNKGTKVIVDLDDALSIVDPNFKEVIEDFQRFLYISASRVQDDNDICFKLAESNIEKLLKVCSSAVEMNSLKYNVEMSSEELCRLDVVEFLLKKLNCPKRTISLRGIRSKKIELIQLLNSLWNTEGDRPDLVVILAINKLYNSQSNWPVFSIHDLMKITGRSKEYIQRHKSEILAKIEELLKKLKNEQPKEPRIATGKTIGELMKEEEESEKDSKKKEVHLMSESEIASEVSMYGVLFPEKCRELANEMVTNEAYNFGQSEAGLLTFERAFLNELRKRLKNFGVGH